MVALTLAVGSCLTKLDLMSKMVRPKTWYPRGYVFLDRVVLAHVSKALNVAQGINALIDAAFPEEAFGLSRTMVEIALNLRFITNRNSEILNL
jgi:hypothetical protein